MIFAFNMSFDFMLIDGDHRPGHIDRDVAMYSPFVTKGGYLILHDTVACRGVKAVFGRMKDHKDYTFISEFVTVKHHRPCGIGVFRKEGK